MSTDRARTLAEGISHHKRIAVGSPFPTMPTERVAAPNTTFKDAVTVLWTWYRERSRHDIQFLIARADAPERLKLATFARVVDDQRHFNEHSDYKRADEARAWRAKNSLAGSPSMDQDLIDALLIELCLALECLNEIAARVASDQAGCDAWRRHASVSPEEEVRAVFADLGRDSLPQPRIDYAVRTFMGHRGLQRARTPHDRAQIAALIAIEVSLDPLSVRYDEILDEFGLVGDQFGYALLLVAHGVEAAGFRGPRLLPVLRRVWPEISQS